MTRIGPRVVSVLVCGLSDWLETADGRAIRDHGIVDLDLNTGVWWCLYAPA